MGSSGGGGYNPVKGIQASLTDPKKALLSAATGGLSAQADSLSGGTKVSDALETGVNSATGALKGLGGGAAHTASVGMTPQASRDIDANKYINAAPTVAPQAQAYTAQGTTINQGPSDQARAYQNFLSQQLQAQTLGQGPSLAQGQFQQNLDQSLAAQNALAASAHGGNLALAQRGAAMNSGNLNLQAAQQAAQLRQQEQLQAQGLLGTTAGQMRGQDTSLATSQAQLGQANNQFNASAQQQNSQYNASQQQALNNLRQQYMQMGLTADQANQRADSDLRNSQTDIARVNAGIAQGNTTANSAYNGAILNGLGQAASAGIGMYTGGVVPPVTSAPAPAGANAVGNASTAQQNTGQLAGGGSYDPFNTTTTSDKRAKKDVKDGGKDVKNFLDALAPHTYTYKNQKDGAGPHTSVMAQELEKTKMGKQMVKDTPEGKKVDYGQGMAAILAGQAYLNQRLTELEAAKKKPKGKK